MHLIFFSTLNVENFTYRGVGQGGRASGGQGALSVQKNENNTIVPIQKIKFCIIYISIFFPTMDIKIFIGGWGGAGGSGQVGFNFFFTYYYIISSM